MTFDEMEISTLRSQLKMKSELLQAQLVKSEDTRKTLLEALGEDDKGQYLLDLAKACKHHLHGMRLENEAVAAEAFAMMPSKGSC